MRTSPARSATQDPAQTRGLLGFFTAAIFTSAFLLFLMQPMFSKMVLPLLGGTPAVWNTCMLFFQTTLLTGYLYAHLSARCLAMRVQLILQLAILTAALLTLPITIGERWIAGSGTHPTLWLLGLLAASLGLPFFILSSTGPLLQKWFSDTHHPDAHNPYFLYAASNLGSMIALLGYPLLLEPRLRLAEQGWVWTAGFGLLLLLTTTCAGLLWRARPVAEGAVERKADSVRRSHPTAAEPRPAAGRRLRWILLAFAPSSLLLGVTTYITTDIAAVPLLWVIPLALYLLTFILVFARVQLVPHPAALRIQPFFVIPLVLMMFWGANAGAGPLFLLHLGAFFVTALVCHGELARDRPSVEYLTEFYLFMSVGGALGGAFNTLMAPQLFNTVAEYPLVLALALLLRPWPARSEDSLARQRLDVALPLALLLAAVAVVTGQAREWLPFGPGTLLLISVVFAGACLGFAERPLRFGLGVAALLLVGLSVRSDSGKTLFMDRTFFGTHRVAVEDGGAAHVLYHGTTIHGTQLQDPERRLEITTYYHRAGPVGQIFDVLHARAPAHRVGVVGLGAGSIACYGREGEAWTYFEIDPIVERIARDPRHFTFLRDCPPDVRVVIGDARITLAREPNGALDLLIVDAFSSDAIPLHLLTREAVALYLSKLAPDGVLALHVSNRHLQLEPVLARLHQSLGLIARFTWQTPDITLASAWTGSASQWAVFARTESAIGDLSQDSRWRVPVAADPVGLWTDDFANILSIYKWR